MKRKTIIFCVILASFGLIFFGMHAATEEWSDEDVQMAQVENILAEVATARLSEGDVDIDFAQDDEVNVLLLGLDTRKEDENPHCDAIHMFTLDLEGWGITITTVPRGTYAYIPQRLEETEYYLANACSYEGLEYGIEQIEKVIGQKADYVATVNFSQTLGILRLLDLPTTETLQWLRHRQTYAIGEPQRAHNQAVFLKDMIVDHLQKFQSSFTLPMQYLVYSFVDTDMDFATARALLHGFMGAEIDQDPDKIELVMRPHYDTVDYHFDPETIYEQIEDWTEFLRPYLSSEDLSELSLEEIQDSLITYIADSLESPESLQDIVDRQLWLQVEDDETREYLHYDVIKSYTATLEDPDEIIDILSLYILEKETLELEDWAQKGKQLLSNMIE